MCLGGSRHGDGSTECPELINPCRDHAGDGDGAAYRSPRSAPWFLDCCFRVVSGREDVSPAVLGCPDKPEVSCSEAGSRVWPSRSPRGHKVMAMHVAGS